MENATKALLIAAAILIAIVLIGISIKVLSSSRGATEEAGAVSDTMRISIFNSHFTQYEGQQKANSVRDLVRLVKTTNSQLPSNRQIRIYAKENSGAYVTYNNATQINNLLTKISNYTKFTVTALDNTGNDGYVDRINIDMKN